MHHPAIVGIVGDVAAELGDGAGDALLRAPGSQCGGEARKRNLRPNPRYAQGERETQTIIFQSVVNTGDDQCSLSNALWSLCVS